jgi:C1A family cysteine protease
MKRALNSGPAVAGLTVYQSFTAESVAATGIIQMPKAKESVVGGHAVCFVGYDDKKKILKFLNSWGAAWGDHGYGYLPYDYFREQSSDCWTFRYAGASKTENR